MDHMIKEKFIVTDGEKVTDEIYRVTGLDIEIDQIIENISSEESNIYFFDKDLSEKPENEKDVILAWIDTGIKVNGNEPLMISLLKRSDYFSGYYVGTPSYLVNGMCRKTLYSEKKLRSNLLKFCHRYREEHAERICKVETEVKDRSEGYCEKTIFIKNEEVLSNVTEAIYGRLLFPNWKSMKGLDRYIKIIGATKTGPLVDQNGDQAHWNIYIKKYLGDAMGAPSTLIPKEAVSIYNAGTQCVQELFDGKRVFENVKPVNVIQYFINMAAKDGDIVMDFFSGSATTAHAVMQTEADKNIDLHYILVQIPQECDKKSEAYKAGYKTICEIGKERIRRAAEKIKRENGCENRDFGFRVLRLDESNMEDVYYMPEEYTQEMLYGLETNIKPDRTDLDLLFACLTEWGLLLSKPYSSEKISGYTVHYYDGKELAACFNENISETVIRKIAGQHPRRAVFCDASFSDSAAKINMSELFRTISPETQIKVI